MNPEIQEKVQQEIDTVIEGNGGVLTYEGVSQIGSFHHPYNLTFDFIMFSSISGQFRFIILFYIFLFEYILLLLAELCLEAKVSLSAKGIFKVAVLSSICSTVVVTNLIRKISLTKSDIIKMSETIVTSRIWVLQRVTS